ncbi:MAG: orotidine-5'-phosphate decarboxylase [Candidatus Margulisbacteria bacterium]|nr:orotidine-5'-phosphate decarboxylase [Candidatus Margulisiibacteriota bacterium]
MNFREKLKQSSKKNNSLLCVGLDVDLSKIPSHFINQEDPIYLFNREIINATKELVCAYKPNMAFYEMHGIYGLQALIKTTELINTLQIPVILDGKRGDIGNTSAAYAKSAFEVFGADAVTVAPYMGEDSVAPFLEYKDKGIFVLCLTSNHGSADFQTADQEKPLYRLVAEKVKQWDTNNNCGLVVGATNPAALQEIRAIVGEMPILLPGVGAQGGEVEACVNFGADKNGENIIINASRSIIYSASPREAAAKLRDEINNFRK